MSIKVGINGFGRIGRNVVRAAVAAQADIDFVAVNDLATPHVLAHLLRYDSIAGRFPLDIEVHNDHIDIGSGKWTIKVTSERDPAQIPWSELGADVVVESTGLFTSATQAHKHIDGGASKVIIAAPATGEDVTIVLGVNDEQYVPDLHHVISNASCTTNCLAVLTKVLQEGIGIEQGMMTTVHAYTQDQNLQDGPHQDLRRARAAAVNIVPTSSGAAKAIGVVQPELAGKLDAFALRVPVADGSVTDLTATLSRTTTTEEVNDLFRHASSTPQLSGILDFSTEQLVSSDIIGNSASCVFDSLLTRVNGTQVKVVGWYDNEWGYSNRVVDLIVKIAANS